jgi:hypothetical protein
MGREEISRDWWYGSVQKRDVVFAKLFQKGRVSASMEQNTKSYGKPLRLRVVAQIEGVCRSQK